MMLLNSICVIGDTEEDQDNIDFLQNIGIFIKNLGIGFLRCKTNHNDSLSLSVEFYDVFTDSPKRFDEFFIVGYIFIPGGFSELSLQLKELKKHEEKDIDMKPVILTPKSYWEPFLGIAYKAIQKGFTPDSVFDEIYIADNVDDDKIKEILVNMTNI